MSESRKLLEIKNLSKEFDGLSAVSNLNFSIQPASINALIGPNGAGKTTVFNIISGFYNAHSGDVYFKNKRITNLPPHKIARSGISRTFQNIRLFAKMTVLENVMIGRHCRTKATVLGAVFRNRTTRDEEQSILETSYAILEKVGLEQYVNEFANNLPYGAQRRLEVARALATEPLLLLLDEPAAGMNPQETIELEKLIKEISSEGQSILLIEHDMTLVMSLSDRIFVMDYGKKIAEGTPVEIRENPAVIKAYLGEDVDA